MPYFINIKQYLEKEENNYNPYQNLIDENEELKKKLNEMIGNDYTFSLHTKFLITNC